MPPQGDEAEKAMAQRLRGLTGHQIPHDGITRPSAFMGYRMPCHDCLVLALSQLVLVKPLRARVKAERKRGRLHLRPSQIGVAIFDMALALTFAMLRLVLATHRPYEAE